MNERGLQLDGDAISGNVRGGSLATDGPSSAPNPNVNNPLAPGHHNQGGLGDYIPSLGNFVNPAEIIQGARNMVGGLNFGGTTSGPGFTTDHNGSVRNGAMDNYNNGYGSPYGNTGMSPDLPGRSQFGLGGNGNYIPQPPRPQDQGGFPNQNPVKYNPYNNGGMSTDRDLPSTTRGFGEPLETEMGGLNTTGYGGT